uniref:Ig-like domain-containing protein n=1 Tax=Dicentrarchus labrax TaxID=13489 RepID=A0A8C4EXR7_DICLA
ADDTDIPKAVVTRQPNWPQIYYGEKITLRCEIDGGGDTQWTYEWEPTSSNTQSPTHSEYRIISAQWSHSGEYRCKGRKDSYSSTEWSDYIRLTVSCKLDCLSSIMIMSCFKCFYLSKTKTFLAPTIIKSLNVSSVKHFIFVWELKKYLVIKVFF